MGFDVEFPQGKRPFPAQFAVMNKVLTALKTEQHALLESPTGSGKTLALLCSTLTFQKQFTDSVAAKKKRVLPNSFGFAAEDADKQQAKTEAPDKPKSKRVTPPRIFFCSRTHSQLAQVVDELKSCPVSYLDSPEDNNTYTKQLQTCVLGSKRNLCVNRKVNRDPSQVDDKCRLALENSSCSYFRKRKKTNDLRRAVPPVWDIEDLVKLAQKHRECAYFHAREALDHANIVFAPYNYLLDPTIREAVGITLKDSVIVLDEAHNVEDTCRSSASVEVTADTLAASIKAFSIVIKHGNRPKTYNALLKLLNGISRWLQSVDSNANAILQASGYEEKSKVWDGADALAMLAEYSGLTKDNLAEMKTNVQEVREYENELGNSAEANQQPQTKATQDAAANPTGASVLLVQVDVEREREFSIPHQEKRKRMGPENVHLVSDAAVAFSDIASQARSVILTSGTLSPMESFAGELGVDFPIRLEANHVVNMRKQVFIGAIMNGPGNVDLQSTYNNQQDPRYQDSMGQLLLQYSQSIPGGILMFFPSYSLLNKLTTRWKKTKLWGEIEQFKSMYSEPRNAGKDFDALLDDYKDTITRYANGGEDQKTGAIFLAVYRGKVSEGIDFSNDNARAVLCVGIPFPSVKELQVSLKRKYQDEKSRLNVKLVNGHIWYNLQAFRALNQALGRCIRHRQDYGAIMLLDSRHRFNKHTRSLSKWMRPFIQEFEHAQMCLPMFSDFFQRNKMELPQTISAPVTEAAGPVKNPLVLEYEVDKKGKKPKDKRKATPSLSATLATVKDFMAKQEGPQENVFSIFRPQKSTK
eukprot:jgi/Phyca11/126714/e_gw1.64.11.1